MSEHGRFAATALRLIERNGRTVTFKKLGAKELKNPDRPELGHKRTAPVSVDRIALITNFSDSPENQGRREQKMKKLLVPAYENFKLEDFTSVVDQGQTYSIGIVDPLQPGDQLILYKAEVSAT